MKEKCKNNDCSCSFCCSKNCQEKLNETLELLSNCNCPVCEKIKTLIKSKYLKGLKEQTQEFKKEYDKDSDDAHLLAIALVICANLVQDMVTELLELVGITHDAYNQVQYESYKAAVKETAQKITGQKAIVFDMPKMPNTNLN